MRIEPANSLKGSLKVPGDKSLSHRYAILGAMASGTTHIDGFGTSQDCQSTLRCLKELGVVLHQNDTHLAIESRGWRKFRPPSRPLDAGNSGTTIRLLSGVLAFAPFTSVIDGDKSLQRRPMGRIILPLSKMGASITSATGATPPLTIQGTRLHGIRYELPVASAQVKSCVLLAGLGATGRTVVIEKTQTRDHTERALGVFGVKLDHQGEELALEGPCELLPANVTVPADLSSAVYFIAAALLSEASDITLEKVGVNPTRAGMLMLLMQSGADIARLNADSFANEPVCDLRVRFGNNFLEKFPAEISGAIIPNVIDELPILAILGTHLKKGLTVRDAGELRNKESDRIHSIVYNLRAIGVDVTEFSDGFTIPGQQLISGGRVRSFGDHRIAMAFAVAGILSESGVSIDDASCADVSFPGFFGALRNLTSQSCATS